MFAGKGVLQTTTECQDDFCGGLEDPICGSCVALMFQFNGVWLVEYEVLGL